MKKSIILSLLSLFLGSCSNNFEQHKHSKMPDNLNIALMVPITGANAAIGNSIANASKMAILDSKKTDIKLSIIDTGSDSLISEESINSVKSKKFKIIIGPLFSTHTQQVSDSIPDDTIISFSNDSSIKKSSNTYLAGLMPEQQVKKIIDYACDHGYCNIYSILPKSKYGDVVRKTLVDRPDAKYIVKSTMYYDSEESIEIAAQEILSIISPKAFDLSDLSNGSESEKAAVLIPEGGRNLMLIMHYIAKHKGDDMKNVKFIGTSQWGEDEASAISDLNGAWISSPSNSLLKSFRERYRDSYGDTPPYIAALGYDLTKVITNALQEGRDFRSEINTPSGFTGFTGTFRFLNNGENERDISIYQITNGKFVIIDTSIKSGE